MLEILISRIPTQRPRPLNKSKRPHRLKNRDAYSILEVLVAMSVLTVVGYGTITGLMQTRRLTEGSIYLNTATTIAQGYIEQLKNMEFDSLDGSEVPTVINQGEADPLDVSPPVADPEVGNSGSDILNEVLIDLQNTPDNPEDDLKLTVVVYIQDTTNKASGIGDSRHIALRYSFVDATSGKPRTYSNTLYAIRSKVPTF